MEASTKAPIPQTMMMALTRSYNAYTIFKKCQVEAAVLLDPTHSREEFDESITAKMDVYMSHNAVSGVLLPAAFIAQDYSAQINELREKRKAESLLKPSRKAKRAAIDSEADEPEEAVKHRVGGKTCLMRKEKSDAKFSTNDGSDSDDQPMSIRKKKRSPVESDAVGKGMDGTNASGGSKK